MSRDDDLLAAKLAKMLFESFRGLGDAGDCGIVWGVAFGILKSASSDRFGDLGLLGLMGVPALGLSLPGFPRMASDKVEDLGIFLNFFEDESQGY